MSFFVAWLIVFVISLALTGGCMAWDLKHQQLSYDQENARISLQNVLAAIAICAIPFVNYFVIFATCGYFFIEIAPKITVFGKRP